MITGTADKVVDDTVKAARAVFGEEIEAIFTLGSLAHGGFAPLVSDVDVAIVLGSTTPDTADRIAAVQSLVVEAASSPLVGAPLVVLGRLAGGQDRPRARTFASVRSTGWTCSTPGTSCSGPDRREPSAATNAARARADERGPDPAPSSPSSTSKG